MTLKEFNNLNIGKSTILYEGKEYEVYKTASNKMGEVIGIIRDENPDWIYWAARQKCSICDPGIPG